MKRYDFEQQHGELGQMRLDSDGEWIRYADHADAMKRIAGDTTLLEYVLQEDLHNRLTPRVIDIAYTAFMAAKRSTENGEASDWFNDTRPVIREAIGKLRKDLLAASPADQVEDSRDA